jgi:hypothetical protein
MVPYSQTRGAANASLNVLVLPKGRYDSRHKRDCPGEFLLVATMWGVSGTGRL